MASEESSKTRTTYHANCHCGRVRYSVTLPESLDTMQVTRCNCSICVHNGYLNVYPKREDVVFHSGYDTLKSYWFAKRDRPHMFCPECGSSILIDFKDIGDQLGDFNTRLAINIRHLRGIGDLEKLSYRTVNGQAFEPPYESWIDEKK